MLASSVGKDLLFNEGNIDWEKAAINAVIGSISGAVAGAGADNIKSGAHLSKFMNGRDILNKTIENGTKSAIARQTNALYVHTTQLTISGLRYLAGNTVGVLCPQIKLFGE